MSASGEMAPGQRRVAFFDFDKTLVDCNSGNLWLVQEIRARRMPLSYGLRLPLWILQYRLGAGDLTHMYDDAFDFARGQSEAEMIERVRMWYDTQVRHRVRPGALKALRAHRDAGDWLVLATSSSQYVASLATEALGLDEFVCTRMEVSGGLFTGRLVANALGPCKAEQVAGWAVDHEVDLASCTFYTDSITDRALLERVGHPVAVNPDRRLLRLAREHGWPIEDWGRSNVVYRLGP